MLKFKETKNSFISKIFLIFFLVIIFSWGVIIGHYKIFPYNILQSIKHSIFNVLLNQFETIDQLTLNEQFLNYAFTKQVSQKQLKKKRERERGGGGLIYPALETIDDLYLRNNEIFVNRELFFNAYNNIELGIIETYYLNSNLPIVKVNFKLNNKKYESFAYGKVLRECGKTDVLSALIIPGSGDNQSSGIFLNEKNNYHYGIINALEDVTNVLVQIKPNEDARNWHNGSGKYLNEDFIYNWHIMMGGSYSISYIVEAMALTKYIKSCSHKSIVAGLSQGGAATLYVALQSSPDFAIVSSGFSILSKQMIWAGFDQLMGIPGSEELAKPNGFINAIKNSPTKYFFTWGKKEKMYYRSEAKNRHTDLLMNNVANFNSISHEEGHIFPSEEIKKFLRANLVNLKVK
jgi:predicted esterase